MDTWFRRLQLVSSGIFSFSHGTNDAQKVMGIIAVVLFGTIWKDQEFHIQWWMILSCHAAIGLGTFFGGWRIVRTMGHSLTKLAPIGGFSAETGGGVTIIALAKLGIPVSTTHTITGAIVGVGSTKGWRAVKWGVAGRIIWAWVFTIPAAAAGGPARLRAHLGGGADGGLTPFRGMGALEGRAAPEHGTEEGTMAETSGPHTISTKLERIATLARQVAGHGRSRRWPITSTSTGCARRTGARARTEPRASTDRRAEEYAANLEGNLRSLLERAKSGTYRAPPVRAGTSRRATARHGPLGIPTFEDKVLQRAVAMVLEAVYEQDFRRLLVRLPARTLGASSAGGAAGSGIMETWGGWVIEVDIGSSSTRSTTSICASLLHSGYATE